METAERHGPALKSIFTEDLFSKSSSTRLSQNFLLYLLSHPCMPGWRNWQTQRTQNPPGFGPWGFDSPSRHQTFFVATLQTAYKFSYHFRSYRSRDSGLSACPAAVHLVVTDVARASGMALLMADSIRAPRLANPNTDTISEMISSSVLSRPSEAIQLINSASSRMLY